DREAKRIDRRENRTDDAELRPYNEMLASMAERDSKLDHRRPSALPAAAAAGRPHAASQTHNGGAPTCSTQTRIMPRNFPKDCNVTHTGAWARSVRAAEVPRTVPVPSAASKRSVMPGPSGRRTTCQAIRAFKGDADCGIEGVS